MDKNTMLVKKLSDGQISEIELLIKSYYDSKKLMFKLEKQSFLDDGEKAAHILHYEDGKLTAYMVLSYFNGEELECTPIAEEKSAFIDMYIIARKFAQDTQKKQVLFISDKNYTFMEDLLKELGMSVSFAEHRMTFNSDLYKQESIGEVEIKYDKVTDDGRSLIYADGLCVGKIRIENVYGVVGIYGFEIKEELQGKGFGRRALSAAICDILKTEYKKLYLEVETNNAPALHLYKAMGFETAVTFNYFC